MRKAIIVAAVLLLIQLPVRAGQPSAYFSLTTSGTFRPADKPKVHLYARNVDALDFRVYKINDAVRFFEQLDDVHAFGHHSPIEQIDRKTLLEQFHDWKQQMWISLRDFFRFQFSGKSRTQIRESLGRARKSKTVEAVGFAQAPILNNKQLVARWRQQLPPTYFSEAVDVPIDSLHKGLYVVEATNGELRAYTLVLIGDMGLVVKTAPQQLVAFAADRTTGSPVAGADVRLWSGKKEQRALHTDAFGLAEAAMPPGRYEEARVVAVHDDDVALVAPYYFNLSSNPEQDWTGYIYTDRPVYRPGHTVHFKGIVRRRDGEHYQLPSGQVQVQIEDSASNQVFQQTLPLTVSGTVAGDLELAGNATLGYYSITIRPVGIASVQMNGGFRVEEYKKPEYEVRVSPDKARLLQGDTITATIDAKYYFGEPVADATVKYVVHTSLYWSPYFESAEGSDDEPSLRAEEGEGGGDEDSDYAGAQVSEQTGKLDENGRLKIQLPTQLDKNHRDARYRIEARVTDAANREIAGHSSVITTYGSFQVGVRPVSYVFKQGEKIAATAMALDYDGHPVETAIHATLVRPRTYGRREQSEVKLASSDIQTGKDGSAVVEFTTRETGNLEIRVTATTPEQRVVTGETWLWISGGQGDWWEGAENRQIRMVKDKKSYQIGDVAHVLLMTNVPESYILVTTEGRTVQSKRIVHATSDQVIVDVPIVAEHQPNIYLSATFFRENSLYQSSKSLSVPAVEQKLSISIEPSKKQFTPGEKGGYTVKVLDPAGRPAIGDFSLGVVDEAIYAIHPDSSGDIQDSFYGAVYDRVATESSLNFSFSGEAGTRPMLLAAAAKPLARLAQLKPETMVQPKIRKVFPDTALWLADLHTDRNGLATAQLEFPDSLTTWRATVRGATLDTKVGSAVNKVIVRKNLMVRLAVPRFFRQGDEVVISAIVHNYLTSTKQVQVSLDLKGLDVISGSPQQIQVPSRGEAKLDWRVRAENVREAVLTTKALTNEESDAMELTLPVIPLGVKLADAKAGSIGEPAGSEDAEVELPGDPALASPTLDIGVSPSIAGSVFQALDYLTSYPYGCTEQTMSSFLPDVVVARALKDLKIHSNIETPELGKQIQAGYERLYDFQHDDGGWGWWKDDESQVFMTAYVIGGFAQAGKAGYAAREESLHKGEGYLRQALKNHPNMRADLRAYVIYALALNGSSEHEYFEATWEDRKNLSSEGLAMLGLAMQASGDQRMTQIAEMLEKLAKVEGAEASWPSTYDYLMEFEIDDSAEATAFALRFLSLARPQSPILPKAALYLVNHRNGGYFWDSTKQTAMVIFGLTEFLRASHEFEADFTAEVSVNGKLVLTRRLTRDDVSNSPTHLMLPAAQLASGKNVIRVTKKGTGRLYWSARGEYYTTGKKFIQTNRLSLNLTRDYFRLMAEQTKGRITYRLDPLSGELHSGDVLAVRLTVGGGEWRYLMTEDPIPAGAEFIQRDDLYELQQRPAWWENWWARREFHDDRATFFDTYFKDRQTYTYLLKVVNPGKFQVSPASVQPMYQPGLISTTDTLNIEVKQ